MSDTTDHTQARDEDGPGHEAAETAQGVEEGQAVHEGQGDNDSVDQAMDRLREADPGDTQEVLDAGNEASDRLQERMRETAPE